MKDLRNKIAVVTGAASGIGRGMAEAFIDSGMKVVLADIEQGALEETTHSLLAIGADVYPVVTDVSKPDQVENLAQRRGTELFRHALSPGVDALGWAPIATGAVTEALSSVSSSGSLAGPVSARGRAAESSPAACIIHSMS